MRLGEGKMVIEVLTPLAVNKDTPLRSFVPAPRLRGVIFAGDDLLTSMQFWSSTPAPGSLAAFALAVEYADTIPALSNMLI